MLPRAAQRRLLSTLQTQSLLRPSLRTQTPKTVLQRRWLTPAPRKGETLMERRADRELPDIDKITFRWRRSLTLFIAIIALSSLAIFNYQKSSSSVVASTLYALRTSPAARALLGDEIYFAHRIPWISGEMNQLHGRIDISFKVRGSKGVGTMKFTSFRVGGPKGLFETTEWSLQMEDGTLVDLLDDGDPFRALPGVQGGNAEDLEETRGFRQSTVKKQA